MIFTAWEFNIPYFVYYYNTNILYNICLDDPSPYQLNHVSILVNNYIKNKLLNNKLENLNLLNNYDNFYYGIGYISNLGHYFWQEILGLIFLIKTNLIMKIKNIIIGNNDCLNFKYILEKEYKHLTIIDGNNFNYSNCIITSFNCTIISNNIVESFQKIYFKYYNFEKINNHEIENNNEIENNKNIKVVTFIIRNGLLRNVENNFEIIYETIIYFLKKYNNYKLVFYFTGWFFYGNDNNISLNFQNNNDNKICYIQKNFINDIINKVKIIYPECNIIDMIGLNINQIINIFKITNFLYDETGTSSMFATTIFNYKSIWSTPLKLYDDFLKQCEFLNNKNKIIPLPKKYINMINDNSYNIDKNGYLITLSNINHF